MHPNAEHVQAAISGRGLDCQVIELPASTRTAADAAKALATSVAQIIKSLLFIAGDEPLLVLASGINRVNVDKLSAVVGGTASRADADTVKKVTGFPIGGVAPTGLKEKVRVLIDEDLRQHRELWAAAGTPHAVFRCSPDDLVSLTGGTFVDLKEEC
jgi:prolyl-tRNA editing enzyme YbaK/EbsC (Cys-tRNA(Pro) deacylase)